MQDIRFLEKPEMIQKVERMIKRVEFSIFYRSRSVQMTQENIKSFEKLLRFLENDSNEKHRENWMSVIQQTKSALEKGYQAVENAKPLNDKEEAFLEELRRHTFTSNASGKKAYAAEYFESILPYAEINGDCEEFTNEQIQLMLITKFIESKSELGIVEEEKDTPTETKE
jgi:chemotaxis regulatin CheY-phosphate phosphatase CheZ